MALDSVDASWRSGSYEITLRKNPKGKTEEEEEEKNHSRPALVPFYRRLLSIYSAHLPIGKHISNRWCLLCVAVKFLRQ
jgi:hypothetical protein